MGIKLDILSDNTIDCSRLKEEFAKFPVIFYRYMELKVNAEDEYERAKATWKEFRSLKYKELKGNNGKMTEKNMEAELDSHSELNVLNQRVLEAKRDLETLKAYVESLRAKKDMLIQLGADARQERL